MYNLHPSLEDIFKLMAFDMTTAQSHREPIKKPYIDLTLAP